MTGDSQVLYQFQLLTEQVFAANIQEEVLDIVFNAAGEGSPHIVNFLIKEGKTWKGGLHHTAAYEKYLHAAVEGTHLDIIEFLVENGADHKIRFGDEEKTLLHIAAENDHVDLIKPLLKKGMNIDVLSSNGETALHYAAAEGGLETVKFLVNRGANIRGRYPIDMSVHVAARVDIIKFLVENGAYCRAIIGQQGRTVLHFAAENNDLHLIKILLNKGLNIEVQDFYHRTALYYATTEGSLETVKFLVNSGAKTRIWNRNNCAFSS
ncbi:hypothetical protein VKT23_011929 [Stygiomarasmius scandens]|uniref:Uncharacterized protein n=1 Tax=Marasmiellus scandens TaxID=2682957 RepID=A0ABR1J865_9AGAR